MRKGQFERPRGVIRVVSPRILIACEGAACEKGYFEAVRMDLRLPQGRITVLPHAGTDPLSVVNAALEGLREAKADRSWDPALDEAWAVFDVDDKRRDEPGQWNDAIQRAGDRIRLAISSPAFELWYLIHFQDQRGCLDRVQARRLLEKHLPSYEKSQAIYSVLKPTTSCAMRRSNELDEMHRRDRPDQLHPNPSTGVAILVQRLLHLTGG
jgi:hypothetical protein